jgi:type VI secretion system secreted protein Hcp
MATEIYLTLDGITGESQKTGAEGWIEIFAFSNGAHNPSGVSSGTGSGTGKVDISTISLQKQLDSSSQNLFLHCCNGTHISKGTMVVREATGSDTTQTFFQYDMTEVFIDSISWNTSQGAGGKPNEAISISSKTLQITYVPQNADGSLGSKQVTGWDISKNNKL